MTKSDKKKAKDLIESAATIGLVSHVRMDPDAYGSILGTKEVLESLGKKVVIFSEEELIPLFKDFDSGTKFAAQKTYQPVDLIIILDTGDLNRIAAPEIIEKVKQIPGIVIDHHATEPVCLDRFLYFIEQAGAASEIAYNLFEEFDFKISKKAAGYFCVGILSDTNDLNYSNATGQTKKTVDNILDIYGKDIHERYLAANKKDHEQKVAFYEYCYQKSIFSKKYQAVITPISKDDLIKFNMAESIGSQVANFAEEQSGIASFVFMEAGGKIKASLRSNKTPLNVRELAESYGGGGHDNAAGFITTGTLSQVVEKFL